MDVFAGFRRYNRVMKKVCLLITLMLSIGAVPAQEVSPRSAEVETVVPEPKTETELLQESAEAINDEIQILVDDLEVLGDQIEHSTGDRLEVLILERQQKTLDILEDLFELAANLEAQNALGEENAELRDMVVSYLVRTSNALDRFLDSEELKLAELRSSTDELSGIQQVKFEQDIAATVRWLEQMIEGKLRTIQELEKLGVSTSNHRENLISRIQRYASNLSGQLQIVDGNIRAIRVGSGGEGASGEVNAQIEALNIRRASILTSLTMLVRSMGELGLDTREIRQLLLETGEVTSDLFDPEIVFSILKKQILQLLDSARDNAGTVFAKLVIFVFIIAVFRVIARAVNYMIRRSFDSQTVQVSKLMQDMLLSVSSKGITFLGILVALGQMGLEITALLTGLGIAGFIVGFALQDSLANFVAGIMILGYRPFDVGDVIEAGGVFGKVSKMSLVSTTVLTFDNQTLIVPNNKIWGDVIKNITLQHERRIDLEFHVGLKEDIGRVRYAIHNVLEGVDEILDEPAPSIEFNEMSGYSMVFVVRPWVAKEVYWPVRWRLMREIKQALDEEGVEIPVVTQGVVLQA